MLLCISAVLLMILAGELLVKVAPPSYAKAAPLIPLTAAAMVTPSLFRTVNGNTSYPDKHKRAFQTLILVAGLIYFGLCWILAPEIGIYAPPIAMFAGFAFSSSWLFIRNQRSVEAITFPARQVLTALLLAAVTVGLYELLPEVNKFAELLVIVVFMCFYALALLRFNVIPRQHRSALAHVAQSAITGRPDRFNARRGLRALDPSERDQLRVAVTEKLPVEMFSPASGNGEAAASTNGDFDAAALVRALREAAEHGGVPVDAPNENDGTMAKFLFANVPQASRDATMRKLLSDGAESTDLTVLESIANHLRKAPPDAWAGIKASESTHKRRRKQIGASGRRLAGRVVRGIGRWTWPSRARG